MSLPVYTASEQRERVITSAPWACCLRVVAGELRVARSALICTASKALYKDNKIILNSFLALHHVLC